MSRRRWIADEVDGDRAALVGEHALHLVRVLRAHVGQEFDIATGDRVRRGRVTSVRDGAGNAEARVDFELAEELDERMEAALTVVLAVFKFDRMEWAIEKCTELGATAIVPVLARRTDVHLAKAAGKRVERWRRIAVQASEQSRRSSVPQIPDPVKLAAVLRDFGADANLSATDRYEPATRIVLAETENEVSLAELVGATEGPVVIAVGPEGGWTEEELTAFSKAGWKSASLGKNILRAETAAIAAVVVAKALNA